MFEHTNVCRAIAPPWRERCANPKHKKEKKRALDGRTADGGRRGPKKARSGVNPVERTHSLKSLINCMKNLCDPRCICRSLTPR